MSTARQSAIRLLQLMMVASLVLPAILFAYASWIRYRDLQAVADERLTRSLDVMQEQALKVFETVDRTFAEVDEIVRGMSDEQIRLAQPSLHPRLERIVGVMPQLQTIVLIDRDGRPMVSSRLATVPPIVSFKDRDYFQAQVEHNSGTYVSTVRTPQLPGVGTDFFDLSRRLESQDGSFRGVIAVAVRPSYFEDFYSLIRQTPGGFYALVRSDGAYLARYPVLNSRERRLTPQSGLLAAIRDGRTHGQFAVTSQIDNVPRHIAYRKLPGFPVYALAGSDDAVIRAEWLSTMGAHLIFGLPATLLLRGALDRAPAYPAVARRGRAARDGGKRAPPGTTP